MLSFNAKKHGDNVQLDWTFANEHNLVMTKVQHSTNVSQFDVINTVEANGNLVYSMMQAQPQKGTNYYKLEHTDLSGKSNYNSIKIVTYENELGVIIYPNPESNTLNIDFGKTTDYTINIIDITGKVVYHNQISNTKNITIDLKHLSS